MISVIISVYNAEDYIEKCIKSIMAQTYRDLEIIAVDDGSTDNSREICRKLAEKDSRIVVLHKENGGNASARNAGIDIAKGEFISFVDSDDYIEDDMYEKMLSEMSDPKVTIGCSGLICTDLGGTDTVLVCDKKTFFTSDEALRDLFLRENRIMPTACNKLYRSSLFKKGVRFNNAVIHEDTEAMPRFLDASEGVMVINQAFYHYIKRVNSASTSKHFNIKGYHILDSMGEYYEMCRKKRIDLLPCVSYYELVTCHGMLRNLRGCIDEKDYKKIEINLCFRIYKSVLKCMRWKWLRNRYGKKIKDIMIDTIWGRIK